MGSKWRVFWGNRQCCLLPWMVVMWVCTLQFIMLHMFSMAFSICNSVFLLYKKDKEKTHHLTMKSHFLIQECPDELLVRVRAKRVLDTLF